jgi:hypothetical protein
MVRTPIPDVAWKGLKFGRIYVSLHSSGPRGVTEKARIVYILYVTVAVLIADPSQFHTSVQ